MALRRALTGWALACACAAACGEPQPAAAQSEEAAVRVTALRGAGARGSLAGPLSDGRVEDAPAQISVVPRAALEEPGVHRTSDALYRDASVADNYPALGYYENFSIRGFTLDPGSAYRINGFVVPAELHTPLDDKDRIEILKGIGLLSAGAGSPGGAINFVTKRPDNVREVRGELTPLGGRYVALDVGTESGAGNGFRLNVAHEEIRPYADKADGRRTLLGIAADGAPTRALRVAADLELQQRSQIVVPGFQLLGGSTLPPISPSANINQQPWSRPVENRGLFAALRAQYAVTPQWKLDAGGSYGRAKISDNLAFPFGCNDPPVQYFCADGSYVLYDYHASELRDTTDLSASLAGELRHGGVSHRLVFGAERIGRRIHQRDYYSTTLLDSAGQGLTGNIRDPAQPLPAPQGVPLDRPAVHADQASVFVGDKLAWQAWELHGALRRVRIAQGVAGEQETARVVQQYALVGRLSPRARVYASAATGLEFGSEAPATAENAGQLLAPRTTKMRELGIKLAAQRASFSGALFRMQRPYEFTAASGTSFAGLGAYQRAGTQVHTGLELSGEGAIGEALKISGSAAAISARARDTGEPAFEGVQVQNIPRLRSTLYASYAFADFPGWELSGGWFHSAPRNARRDGAVSVPAYDRLDAGLSFSTAAGAAYRSRIFLKVTNLTNRRYWRDVSEAYSADLLFPGAPREIFVGVMLQGV